MNEADVVAFVRESNRIEGIHRDPTPAECAKLVEFVSWPTLTVDALVSFVGVYQPGARLRDRPGLNVRVGSHVAPPGGPEIRQRLEALLDWAQVSRDPWAVHVEYETLHPFTDGNGRSGRALWAWMMGEYAFVLGFLHRFYYQTLQNVGRGGAERRADPAPTAEPAMTASRENGTAETSCRTEQDCTQMPWCRINGACHRRSAPAQSCCRECGSDVGWEHAEGCKLAPPNAVRPNVQPSDCTASGGNVTAETSLENP